MSPDEQTEDDYDGNWIECYDCGGTGEGEHDCGEDCCVCRYPEPSICETCGGRGGWLRKEAEHLGCRIACPCLTAPSCGNCITEEGRIWTCPCAIYGAVGGKVVKPQHFGEHPLKIMPCKWSGHKEAERDA